MDENEYCVSDKSISPRTTLEDLLNFNKTQIQSFLKANKVKISGNKLTLGQRAHDLVQRQGFNLVCI